MSLQIRRLEELVAQPLFTRDGRRLALTPAGDVLLDYARFIEPIRVGMVQDFADALFTGVLANFAKLHAETQIYARVAGTSELLGLVERRQIDVAVGFGAVGDLRSVRTTPTVWYGDRALAELPVIPLAVLEAPCRFREAAITALDAAGLRYGIAVETPNLSTLRAAVKARLGVMARSPLFQGPRELDPIPQGVLPELPDVACIVARAGHGGAATEHLAELMTRNVRGA